MAVGRGERRGVKETGHRWEFKARFRRNAFGWRSQPAVQRVKEAVSEIKRVARRHPVLAGDGAVTLLERISPALESVDSSSGSIGTAVHNAIEELVPIIGAAPADPRTRAAWLERLWAASEADRIPYIESLAGHWGELCGSKEVASEWADRLLDITRLALSPDQGARGYFHGTPACFSALLRAERHGEILSLLEKETFWHYRRWAVLALAATGKRTEAIELAESSRGPWTSDGDVNRICEDILLSSGQVAEAYERYGLAANRAGTYLATFRSVARKYPHKAAADILRDLAATTPGQEGKWFAAAKDAGLYEEALELASASPCDPRTLTRAARDLGATQPAFALGAGLLALRRLVEGYGYEITGADVLAAYSATIEAARRQGIEGQTRERIRELVAAEAPRGFVSGILGEEIGL
jgi:hypothetical protein